MIKVTADFTGMTEFLGDVYKKQIPFAAQQAINDVAFGAIKKLRIEAETKLDRPTPFTLRGFKVTKASRYNLTGYVYVDEIQERYMKFQIDGGVRKDKEQGRVIIPVAVKLNKYGNIPGKSTGIAKSKNKVVAVVNGTKGMWLLSGGAKNRRIRLGAYYADKATYKKRFPFYSIADTYATKHISDAFAKRLRAAIRTAK